MGGCGHWKRATRLRAAKCWPRFARANITDRVTQATAQVAQAKAAFDKSHLDFERASNLFSSSSMTKAQFDAAKAAMTRIARR